MLPQLKSSLYSRSSSFQEKGVSQDQVALGVRLASLNEHLHVSRARTLEGSWGGRVLRTSPEQNSENLSPSSESERCESFLDFDVKGLP